ncbi:hypothetical protein HDU98_003043 [Podochytrium sp. JEL0797]|nr:hypothetical protein HDU98_003043 [Podochytrium sp. JEL0797]
MDEFLVASSSSSGLQNNSKQRSELVDLTARVPSHAFSSGAALLPPTNPPVNRSPSPFDHISTASTSAYLIDHLNSSIDILRKDNTPGFRFRHLNGSPSAYDHRFHLSTGKVSLKYTSRMVVWSALVCIFALVNPVAFLSNLPNSFVLCTVLGTTISITLTFRLNTAYDRFWEGCKLWYSLRWNVVNLSRLIQIFIDATPESETEKRNMIYMLGGLGYAIRHRIRCEESSAAWEDVMPFVQHIPALRSLEEGQNMPQHIIMEMDRWLVRRQQASGPMFDAVVRLTDVCTQMERIRTTPIPRAYSIHLAQILMMYLLALPFQLVPSLKWLTIPTSCIVTYTLVGILKISLAIENPFDDDLHDLPTDLYCVEVEEAVGRILEREPSGPSLGWGETVGRDYYREHIGEESQFHIDDDARERQ